MQYCLHFRCQRSTVAINYEYVGIGDDRAETREKHIDTNVDSSGNLYLYKDLKSPIAVQFCVTVHVQTKNASRGTHPSPFLQCGRKFYQYEASLWGGGAFLTNPFFGQDGAHSRPSPLPQDSRLYVHCYGIIRVAMPLVNGRPSKQYMHTCSNIKG